MTKTWILSLGDTHCGLEHGLLLPETTYHKEDAEGNIVEFKPRMTATQELLLLIFEDALKQTAQIIGDDPLVAIHGGDLCHGKKHPSELQTTRLSDQVRAGVDILKRILNIPNCRALFISPGTEAHNGGEGSTEYIAAQVLQGAYPEKRIQCSTHWLLNIGGARFDIAHHGNGKGIRYWTSSNQLLYYTRSHIITEGMTFNCQPVDAIFRYHRHAYVKAIEHYEYDYAWRDCLAVVHPPMCGMNYYAISVTRSAMVQHLGLVLYCIEDGIITRVIEDFIHVLDRRTEIEEIKL